MKYSKLFENDDLRNLTHEVLTQHLTHHRESGWGAGLGRSYYSRSGDHDMEAKHLEMDHHLRSLGWRGGETNRFLDKDDAGDDYWNLAQDYRHPQTKHVLRIAHGQYRPDGPAGNVETHSSARYDHE